MGFVRAKCLGARARHSGNGNVSLSPCVRRLMREMSWNAYEEVGEEGKSLCFVKKVARKSNIELRGSSALFCCQTVLSPAFIIILDMSLLLRFTFTLHSSPFSPIQSRIWPRGRGPTAEWIVISLISLAYLYSGVHAHEMVCINICVSPNNNNNSSNIP